MSKIIFTEESVSPSPPSTGQASIYIKTDNIVYTQNSSGVEVPLGSASSITALTGDVSASGPGSAAATVNAVGGQTASNIASAVTATASATAVNTPNTIVKRDGSGNFAANIVTASLAGTATNVTAATNSTLTTLSSLSLPTTQLTGTLPSAQFPALTGDVTTSAGSVATTLATVNSNVGSFTNASVTVNAKGLITAASSGVTPVTTLGPVGSSPNANAATITANTLNLQPFSATQPGVVAASGGGTANFLRADGTWAAVGSGSVSAVSVASANGFAGTSSGGSTPALTLSTTITGVLKGNGTAISAAVSGTDYVIPSGSITGTASNITATSNSTLTTLSALSLPGSQVTGNISGNAANVTGIVAIANGGTGSATVITSPTATSWVGWDANKNISASNFLNGYATTATAAGTTTLTVASFRQQYFTGSTTQTVTLPVATTLVNGLSFTVVNRSSGIVTVQTSGANTVVAMAANTQLVVICINTAGGTGTASWAWTYGAVQGSSIPVSSQWTTTGSDIFYSTGKVGVGYASPATTLSVAGNALFGAGEGATPSAFTLRGPAATGTNIAGADWTFDASNGTGSGGSGNFIFRTAPVPVTTPVIGTAAQTFNSNSTTQTLSFTVTSGTNRMLIVQTTVQNLSTVSSITYGGVALTSLASATQSGGSNACLIETWYLLAPTVGTANILVTFSTNVNGSVQAYNVTNVNQSTPFATPSLASGSATSASLAPVTSVGQLVIDFIGASGFGAATVTGGQTAIQAQTTGSSIYASQSYKTATAGTTSVSYSYGASANYAYMAVGLIGTTASGTSPSTFAEALRVAQSGNVGIGTTSPATTLQVMGMITPGLDNLYTLGTSSFRFTTIYATNATINTSDAREKTEVVDSDLGVDFINSLRPVSYKWVNGPDNEQHYGFIAQETELVLENFGKTADSTSIVDYEFLSDRYGMRYTELIGPMVKAIQDLTTKNTQLESRISILEAK